MIDYAWVIPVFPLISCIVLMLFGKKIKESAAYIGMAALAISFVVAVGVLLDTMGGAYQHTVFPWLAFGDVTITMGFEITPLNAMMLCIVTLVSLFVHMFSKEYMQGDPRIAVFYCYLGLFSFSMLGLVMAPNILQLFIFWELVGACSYLLIGFWYFKPEAAAAAKKAFLTTRIGDVGLLVGLILTFVHTNSFDYGTIYAAVTNGLVDQTMITVIALLIFLGAVGKSAQFPLHVWLPDAMEGPTPVSALIHAATMVAAGVYLVAVMYPLFTASSVAMTVVAYTGAVTALFAASIALVQHDMKRILAYSTVSQLGFMMLALGTAGYVAGLFHLMTHAFFKALLFLGAGSVIHAVHTQDIREMGGLWKRMPVTAVTFLIGALSIAGIPPLAGFWSKDEIFASVWQSGDRLLFAVAAFTALLTAFYMFRLFFKTFIGKFRGEHLPHENGLYITVPLVVLAVLAFAAGFVNAPFSGHALGEFLTSAMQVGEQPLAAMWIMVVSTVIAAVGILLAWGIYGRGSEPAGQSVQGGEIPLDGAQANGGLQPDRMERAFPGVYQLLHNKYYVDEFYSMVIIRPVIALGKGLWALDRHLVDGFVNLLARLTGNAGGALAQGHNGQFQTYGLVTVLGGITVFAVAFLLRGYIG